MTACELDPDVVTTDAGTLESDGADGLDGGTDAEGSGYDAGHATPADAAAARTEADWIVYMREEEKLARDVYQAFASTSPVFRSP